MFALSEEDETDKSGGSQKGDKLAQHLFSGREIPCLIEHVGLSKPCSVRLQFCSPFEA